MAPQSRNVPIFGSSDEAEARKIDSSDAWNFTSARTQKLEKISARFFGYDNAEFDVQWSKWSI